MTQPPPNYPPQHPQQPPPGWQPVAPAQPVKRKRFGWLALTIAAICGLVLGSCTAVIGSSGGGGTATTAGAPVTVTETAAGTGAPTATVTEPGPTKTVTTQVDHANDKGIGEGTWKVGSDIKAGVYKAHAKKNEVLKNCYWARLKGTGEGDIIANDNSSGQSIVEVKKSDKYFQTTGCTPWVKQ